MNKPMSQKAGGSGWALITCVVIFVGLLIFPYYSGYAMVRSSIFDYLRINWSDESWSHCWLVLPILAWLVYRDRQKIGASIQPGCGLSPIGVGLLLSGCFIYWAGFRANNLYLGYGGIQIILAGVLFVLGGRALFKALLFHWLFLSFLWPLIFLEHTVAFTLRAVLAKVSSSFLNVVGISNFHSGTALISSADTSLGLKAGARFQLDIEGPCSGLRSLFALTMIGALFGYLTQRTKGRGIMLFLCSFPFAMLGNFARLLLLVFGTLTWGSEFAVGPTNVMGESETSKYHFFSGIAVFLVSLSALYITAHFLSGRQRKRSVVKTTQHT